MHKITLAKQVNNGPDTVSAEVEMAFIPRYGEYVDHEPSKISGYVYSVIHYMPENGKKFIIEVKLK